MNHDVFISYSSKNTTTALAMCHVLEQHRIKCWMAPRDIPPGADYGDVIDEAIIACRVFVIIFSEPASVSKWVKRELSLAASEEKHIIPYRIDDTRLKGSLRLILNPTHWIEAYPDAEPKFDELVTGIARYLGISTVAEQSRTDSILPKITADAAINSAELVNLTDSSDPADLTPSSDITADFDPLFAQELQRRGYVADANKITFAEVSGITELDVSGELNDETHEFEGKLTSLRGIEYFESLTTLDCSGNKLTALDVSENTALAKLHCDYNRLTALDVSKNSKLKNLNCDANALTALNISKNTALTELICGHNQLTVLDVNNNIALTDLHCSNNQLTILDVSQNAELTYLDCIRNQLTALDVSKNTELIILDCSSNQLILLDLSQNTKLTSLECDFNELTSLNVSNNIELTCLVCSYNELTSLDVSKNISLTKIDCSSNPLTSLNVSQNTALTELDCYGSDLTGLDVSNNTELTALDCSGNPGDGTVFPVTAWFDNSGIPSWFTTGDWDCDGTKIAVDYRKTE